MSSREEVGRTGDSKNTRSNGMTLEVIYLQNLCQRKNLPDQNCEGPGAKGFLDKKVRYCEGSKKTGHQDIISKKV